MAKKKKVKLPPEPQWYTSVTNMTTWNYNVYYMTKKEKVLYFLLAFLVGAVVGYVFFGGLFKNEFYEATMKTRISERSCNGYYWCNCRKNLSPNAYPADIVKKKSRLKTAVP